jgi:peptide/nickel transport system permease protein
VYVYIARRLVATIPVMAVVAVFVFLLLRLAAGDPAAIIAGDNATSQQVADIRSKLGLDQPITQQFAIWIGSVLQGDLGESFFFKKKVSELILGRLEPTLALAAVTVVLAVALAVPLGVIAGYRHGTWIDRLVMGLSVLGFSVPVFVVGYLLIYVFAIYLNWLPVQGYQPLHEGFGGFIQRLILPAFTLAAVYVALIARITRTSVLEVLNADYVRTARAKGLRESLVVMRHALPNALLPVITISGVLLGFVLGGSVAVEQAFGVPGLGRALVTAVVERDIIVVQNLVLLYAVIFVAVNVLVDLSYAWLDPRIRYS